MSHTATAPTAQSTRNQNYIGFCIRPSHRFLQSRYPKTRPEAETDPTPARPFRPLAATHPREYPHQSAGPVPLHGLIGPSQASAASNWSISSTITAPSACSCRMAVKACCGKRIIISSRIFFRDITEEAIKDEGKGRHRPSPTSDTKNI